MQYFGGKSRIAKDIAGLINAIPRGKKSNCAGDSGNPVKSAGGGRLSACFAARVLSSRKSRALTA